MVDVDGRGIRDAGDDVAIGGIQDVEGFAAITGNPLVVDE